MVAAFVERPPPPFPPRQRAERWREEPPELVRGPAVETSDDAMLIDRIVAITGRNPNWSETVSSR